MVPQRGLEPRSAAYEAAASPSMLTGLGWRMETESSGIALITRPSAFEAAAGHLPASPSLSCSPVEMLAERNLYSNAHPLLSRLDAMRHTVVEHHKVAGAHLDSHGTNLKMYFCRCV